MNLSIRLNDFVPEHYFQILWTISGGITLSCSHYCRIIVVSEIIFLDVFRILFRLLRSRGIFSLFGIRIDCIFLEFSGYFCWNSLNFVLNHNFLEVFIDNLRSWNELLYISKFFYYLAITSITLSQNRYNFAPLHSHEFLGKCWFIQYFVPCHRSLYNSI